MALVQAAVKFTLVLAPEKSRLCGVKLHVPPTSLLDGVAR
jgi:hypothetical protein